MNYSKFLGGTPFSRGSECPPRPTMFYTYGRRPLGPQGLRCGGRACHRRQRCF